MDLQIARQNMIEQQIRTWDVLDPVILELLAEVPREGFIPEEYLNLSYVDTQIPIGHGQTTLQPKIEARILQAVNISQKDTVLEVGTGCGYLTALMAKLGKQVRSIEYFQDLSDSAANVLSENGFKNIQLEQGDIFQSMPANSSYDVIVLTGSMARENTLFAEALKPEGRLFQIIGQSPVMEALLLTRKDNNSWHRESLFETDVTALIGAEEKPSFEF